MNRSFDLCLVSGRRPELLERTLSSFQDKVFCNFSFSNVFVNIDPFCGTEDDGFRVRSMVTALFPEAVIYEPNVPSFGAAVIRLWKSSRSDIVFHLEDDWLALEKIEPGQVESRMVGPVRALSLMCKEKNNAGLAEFHTRSKKLRFMGVPYWKKTINCFSTSPGFFEGNFVRMCSTIMDPNLDPEKQFYSNTNPSLEQYVKDEKTRFMFGKETPFLVEDIGREYRDKHKITKETILGASLWRSGNE